MGAQKIATIQPERILHIAGRMVGGNVERIEVVELRFHFRSIEHAESHGAEEVFDLPLDLSDRMQSAGRDTCGGDSEIHPFGVEPFGQSGAVEGGFRQYHA